MNFIKTAMKIMDNEYASKVDEIVDCKEFIDSGSYVLNALLSGDLVNGGFPMDRITALAGESTTGKTFFALNSVYNFLEKYEDGAVFYFDSESAMTKEMIEERGIDTNRIVHVPVTTIQEFRHQALKVLDEYKKLTPDERLATPIMFVLDSLGNLSSTKEVMDTGTGAETRDMTKAQLIKATFRVLTNTLKQLRVPLIVTNHTYDSMGSMFPTKEVAGGSGIKYCASTIIMLGKRKEKDGTVVIGNIIRCKNYKNRWTKENAQVETQLLYAKGISRYYGLLELAIDYGVWTKQTTRIVLKDGTKCFGKTINNNPEKYFTPEILAEIQLGVDKNIKYGSQTVEEVMAELDEEVTSNAE